MLVYLCCLGGCQRQAPIDPVEISLLAPFQGRWQFDENKTYDAWRAAGVSEEVIAKTRELNEKLQQELASDNPAIAALRGRGVQLAVERRLHPDLNFFAHLAQGVEPSTVEYSFFRLHRHGDTVCGMAWHHEDRFDAGDMSKCQVQLKVIDGALHLKARMQEGLPDLNDPDFAVQPPILQEDLAAGCDAEKPAGSGWSDWFTQVYVRSPKEKL
jgi:hypothetical protein